MAGMGIGELARRTDVKIANIRFYEASGLLPEPVRRQSGHRQYGKEDVHRLAFIRSLRALGFSIDEIKSLMRLSNPLNTTCDEARDLAMSQLSVVRARMNELKAIEKTLQQHVAACSAQCCGGRAPECPILPAMT